MLTIQILSFSIGVAVDCGRLLRPSNGSMIGEETTYPNHRMFSCDEGFDMRGSAYRECRPNGTWSGRDTTCAGTLQRRTTTLWQCHGALRSRADIALAWLVLSIFTQERQSTLITTDHNWSQLITTDLATARRGKWGLVYQGSDVYPASKLLKTSFVKQITTLMDFGELIRNSVWQFLNERSVSGEY